MYKYLLSMALGLALTAAAHAQQQPSAKSAAEAGGKVAVPVGPILPGEEKLSARERAERTFLMPPRKKMPSVRAAAPQPQLDPSSSEAMAIGPPTVEEMAEENAVAPKTTPKAAPKRTYYRRPSAKKKTVVRRSSSTAKKKTTTKRRR